MKKLISEGKHKGWMGRNQISYPEQFWMKILDNNIEYIHEYDVCQSDLGINSDYKYFLDFYLPEINMDLEIDGKQHKYRQEQDNKRDEYLSKKYIVYRI